MMTLPKRKEEVQPEPEPEPETAQAEPVPAVETPLVAIPATPVEILQVSLGDDGPLLETWVPEGATLAVACTWLHGAILPVETALDGRLVASWRLGNSAGPLPGWHLVADSEKALVLHRIENVSKEVVIRLEGNGEVVRLKTSSVVQVGALIELIARHQGVDLSGTWIYAGEQAYPHEALLDELPDSELVLKA
jgi:hypothetical protein